MPASHSEIDMQGGAVVTGNVTTSGGDVIHRDKIISGDDVRGDKYVTVLGAKRPLLYVNVPPMPQHFLGREALVADLVDRLCAGQTTALSADGLPGVGKTTLAVALARDPRLLAHFRDDILWAGLGRTPDVASIQATWADALGVDLRDLIDPYARSVRLTNAMGDRRLLLVLDDVWQWEAAAQLRCSAPRVATLLTTRDQAIARRFAGPHQSVNVPVLAPQPAYDLLAALAPEACATDPAAARRLAALVDGLPLALELLGGYLDANRRTQARRHQALTTLTDPAARLALATQRLGDPQHQAVTLQATIALSLADLPAATVAAFYALGAFAPKPARFDLPAALAVTGADEETLFTLADRNLVEMGEDETLGLHQTLSALARTQLPEGAVSRQREHYLSIVAENDEDWQRIETIYEQLSFAWTQLAAADANTIRFVDRLSTFQTRRGLWQERLQWLAHALNAARHGQDQQAEALMLHEHGVVYNALGEWQQAQVYYEQALSLHRQIGGKAGEATTLDNLGSVYLALGDKTLALAYYEQALPLRRQIGDKRGEAATLNNTGFLYRKLDDMPQALYYYAQALSLQRQIGEKTGEASTLSNLGAVYNARGERQQALAYYAQALSLQRQVGDKAHEATTLTNLGSVYRSLGDMAQALAYYEQALTLRRQVGDKAGEATTLTNMGCVYDAWGEKQQALVYYEQALTLRRQVGDKAGEATTLTNFGTLYLSLGDMAQAQAYCEQALSLACQVSDKAGEAITLNNLGAVYDALGDKLQALGYYEQALPLRRHVGDKAGEAITLNNLGVVYDALGDKLQALGYYEQALPLQRHVGDRWGESITCYNMALVYRALGDLAAAEQCLTRTVELEEAISHPNLASDRAMLAQVRAERGGA